MAFRVLDASFLRTAANRPEWPPPQGVPELAFVGRSNVGKSSMLNALCRKSGLARVSNTPGRTRALQFFELAVQASGARKVTRLRFADLPGYGYAKVSKAEKATWVEMIETYLRDREPLRAVVLIVDARHPPQPADHEALGFLRAAGRPVVVAVTKMDKLSRNQRIPALRAAEKDLGLARGDAVPFSAVEGTGSEALWARLLELARAPAAV
ncbi:MAG TPA: ribosome biogenesis GTP-binding protein YihA/YsxC [Anaeromyxobacteraceae bacterium]|nr:ribosome biogenesis GTP-binding protein YihA/YsxC [Anaeromyxobacteraceae bacterium]